MRRFFFDKKQESNGRILITGAEARHITTVLRIQAGTEIELYDGKGTAVLGEVVQLTSREVNIRILSRSTSFDGHDAPLTLIQSMLKGKKMDFLIQKATELGVHTFIPLSTRFCEKRAHSKHQARRWQRIMLESCKQCGRPLPMQILEPRQLEHLDETEQSNRIMPWEDEESHPLSPALLKADLPTVLLIGPEGGFHADEVIAARAIGFTTVSLGPRILRAETAALAATSILQYLNHNLEPRHRD